MCDAGAVQSGHVGVVSLNPADTTPHALDGRVLAIAEVGDRIVVGGTFTRIRSARSTTPIRRRYLFAFDPATGANRVWPMPEEVGSFALREGGGLIAALRSGFALIDLDSGHIERLIDPEADRPENRFNDGRCDRRGRFWAGTMNEPRDARSGALYRLDPDHRCQRMADDVMVANGLAFSPDDRVMYWSDSRALTIWAFDFDAASGTLANRRIFARLAPHQGGPDGAAVDAEGGYWSACYRGARVMRFRPDGTIERKIRLPVSRVTMCAFGGPDLRTVYLGQLLDDRVAWFRSPVAGRPPVHWGWLV